MNRQLTTLGLARRAGRLIIGTPMVCEAMRSAHPPVYVFCACDVSASTERRLISKCAYYKIPIMKLEASTVMLGNAVGKTGAVAAVALTDAGFLTALHLTDRKGRE